MGLLSNKNKEVLLGPLSANNPVIVQMLGICSALAVTSKLEPAIVMGISVTAVVAFANVIISLIRNTIPNRIRIIVQLVVVAALVTIVSGFAQAVCGCAGNCVAVVRRRHRRQPRGAFSNRRRMGE